MYNYMYCLKFMTFSASLVFNEVPNTVRVHNMKINLRGLTSKHASHIRPGTKYIEKARLAAIAKLKNTIADG